MPKSYEEFIDFDDYQEALKVARKPFRKGAPNFYIVYNEEYKELLIDQDTFNHRQGVCYLGHSYTQAKTFVHIWRSAILRYEFGIIEPTGGKNNEQGISRSC